MIPFRKEKKWWFEFSLGYFILVPLFGLGIYLAIIWGFGLMAGIFFGGGLAVAALLFILYLVSLAEKVKDSENDERKA